MHHLATSRSLEMDARCYLCGRLAGTLSREPDHPSAPLRFQPNGGGPARAIGSLAGLRCAQCDGPLYVDDYEVVPRYALVGPVPAPRRGRPPKRLAAG